jgi:multiple sugar transport system ATP-binding protein
VTKTFGEVVAVDDVTLACGEGEFMVLLGPSGSGKTTLLRLIAGLEAATAGEITIAGRNVTHVPPKDRDIAMVFQHYALYPHMTVRKNLELALRRRKVPREVIRARTQEVVALLQISNLLDRLPRQLSGGQQQRVALGRCLVRNPLVFLFDEPLSNLDAKLRAQMRVEIKRLHARVPTTSVFVTHDQVEAMTLGDRVVVMRDGRVHQVGSPLSVYAKPVNRFVAGFIGAPAMNFLEVAVGEGGKVTASDLDLGVTEPAAAALQRYRGRKLVLGMRPEHLVLGEGAAGRSFEAVVEVVEQLGSEILLEARLGGTRITVARVPAETPVGAGDRVRLSVPPGRLHFFDSETDEAIVA